MTLIEIQGKFFAAEAAPTIYRSGGSGFSRVCRQTYIQPGSLSRIAACLLFSLAVSGPLQAQEADVIQVELLGKTSRSWDDNLLPAYPAGQPEITIQRYRIPAGTAVPWHSHPVINAGVIVSGTLTVMTRDGDRIQVSAGQSIVETVDTWHEGINEGPDTVEIIVFTAGIAGTPTAVQE